MLVICVAEQLLVLCNAVFCDLRLLQCFIFYCIYLFVGKQQKWPCGCDTQ